MKVTIEKTKSDDRLKYDHVVLSDDEIGNDLEMLVIFINEILGTFDWSRDWILCQLIISALEWDGGELLEDLMEKKGLKLTIEALEKCNT